MESNVTLYWFVLPKWFMDMGGFEKEENIQEFVNWARTAFELFGEELRTSMTPLPDCMTTLHPGSPARMSSILTSIAVPCKQQFSRPGCRFHSDIAVLPAGNRSKLWATINEPGVSAMCGYIVGNHPPGKKGHFQVKHFSTAVD